ncbi:MAG TPA: hypothetical protein VL652_34880 [Kutzneria sp.]|nr:hypothetical protein [Kutzneria sp.]
MSDLRSDPLLSGQLDLLAVIVAGARPAVALDERAALRELLKMFLDEPDHAGTVAAFAVVELARRDLAALADSREDVVEAAQAYVEVCDRDTDEDTRDEQRRLYRELVEALRWHDEGTLTNVDGEQ